VTAPELRARIGEDRINPLRPFRSAASM